jgi:hypothetical protein
MGLILARLDGRPASYHSDITSIATARAAEELAMAGYRREGTFEKPVGAALLPMGVLCSERDTQPIVNTGTLYP